MQSDETSLASLPSYEIVLVSLQSDETGLASLPYYEIVLVSLQSDEISLARLPSYETIIFLVQVRLRTKVIRTPRLIYVGFELTTSRS